MNSSGTFSAKKCKTKAMMRSSRLIPGGSPIRKSKSQKLPNQDFSKMSIEELKQERVKAIKAMDFERSQEIASEMNRTEKEAERAAITSAKHRLSTGIDEAIQRYRQRKDEFVVANKGQERQIRLEIQKQFESLRECHIEAITEIEVEKNLELAKQEARQCAGAHTMRKAAQVLAMNNRYEEAREVRQELASKQETEKRKRTGAVTKSYSEAIRKLTAKQARELASLEQSLIDKLTAQNYEIECQREQIDKDFADDIEQLLQHQTTGVLIQLKMSMKRTDVSTQLTKAITAKLAEEVKKKTIPASLAKAVTL